MPSVSDRALRRDLASQKVAGTKHRVTTKATQLSNWPSTYLLWRQYPFDNFAASQAGRAQQGKTKTNRAMWCGRARHSGWYIWRQILTRTRHRGPPPFVWFYASSSWERPDTNSSWKTRANVVAVCLRWAAASSIEELDVWSSEHYAFASCRVRCCHGWSLHADCTAPNVRKK